MKTTTAESFETWRGNDYTKTYNAYLFRLNRARYRGFKTIAELDAADRREAEGWAILGHAE